VAKLGFDAVEFPLRDGFQVTPENAEKGLPELADSLGSYGIKITSVSGPTDERTFAALASCDIGILRIMRMSNGRNYKADVERWRGELYDMQPLCEKYGVKVAVQQHFGGGISASMELRQLLEGLDPRYIGGVWDAAHSALCGEIPDKGIDIIGEYLAMANFKSAYWERLSGPEQRGIYRPYFTTGRQGMCDWRSAVIKLRDVGFGGVFCIHAEYTDEANVESYTREDLSYLRDIQNNI